MALEQGTPEEVIYDKYYLLTTYESMSASGKAKAFPIGSVVEGRDNIPRNPNAKILPSIITKDGFFIPKSVLKRVPSVEIPEEKDLLSKGKEIAKGNQNAAVVGAIIGAGYGFFGNKNVFYSTLIGMAIGGAIGYIVKSNKTDSKSN